MQWLIFAVLLPNTYYAWGAYPSPSVKGGKIQDFTQQYQRPGRLYQGTVKQVHAIFRHGDRAPIGTYPNDPNKNYDWPFGRAQLTDVGKRQHYELGTYLRNRYSGLLTTDPREVVARSSDKDRCIASAQTNLAAFFRPSGKWVWNRELPWQPVPIHTAPGETDWLLNEDAKCPAADEIKKNIMNTPEGIKYGQKYQRLFQYVSGHSGKTVNDPTSVLSVYGITYINKLNNLTIPAWVNPVWDEFTHAADEAFVVGYSSKPFLKMRGGPLIGHIISHMKKYDEEDHSTVQPKAYLYSTHDATISAFLNAVGVFNGLQVPYAATVLVELHEHSRPVNKYTVRMYYRNTTEAEPYQLTVPNCLSDCPLEEFEELLHDMIPKDIKAECHGPEHDHQRQTLITGINQQCCCCNQCGGQPVPVSSFNADYEKLRTGEPGARMKDLLRQMRDILDQHRQTVDKSIQELIRDVEDTDRSLQQARDTYRETHEKIRQQQRQDPYASG